jgi:hypothetical protein
VEASRRFESGYVLVLVYIIGGFGFVVVYIMLWEVARVMWSTGNKWPIFSENWKIPSSYRNVNLLCSFL